MLVGIKPNGVKEMFAGDVTENYLPEAGDRQIYVLRPKFIFQRQVDDYGLRGRLQL
ncbi:hypothetical protein D3C81_2271360 [compost metagenome]